MLQDAIALAHEGDYSLVNDLLNIAQNPFDEHEKYDKYSKPTPMEFANVKLSCSSQFKYISYCNKIKKFHFFYIKLQYEKRYI